MQFTLYNILSNILALTSTYLKKNSVCVHYFGYIFRYLNLLFYLSLTFPRKLYAFIFFFTLIIYFKFWLQYPTKFHPYDSLFPHINLNLYLFFNFFKVCGKLPKERLNTDRQENECYRVLWWEIHRESTKTYILNRTKDRQ